MTARDQHQQAVADAYAQHERLQGQYEAFVASALIQPTPTPTEAFLSDLKAIHAVSPVQAIADLAHDERTEGYARRPFRTNIHD
jgi:hypothetical protein